MRLIQITPTVKRRVRQMILGLFPDVGYVRVTNRGLVILKSQRWTFRREIVPITDLCIYEIPKRIAEKATKKGLGEGHIEIFNQHLTTLMQLKYYSDKFDLLEYVYTQYAIICMEAPIIKTTKILEVQEERSQRLKQFRLVNTDYLYGVGSAAGKAITKLQKNKVYRKIQRLREGLPGRRRLQINFPTIVNLRFRI